MPARAYMLAAALLAACGADTGIIVATVGDPIEELEFQVALAKDGEFILDRAASGERRSVQGRNLRSSPYELLLREGDQSGDPLTVRVLALGYKADKLVSFGVIEPPQAFIRGEVLRRALTLVAVGGTATLAAPGQERTCFRVRLTATTPILTLHTADDADCDGVPAPTDCNDQDQLIYPGGKEICDGKDSNCDNVLAPASQPCYARDPVEPVCREGTRLCYESQGKGQGLDPICTPGTKRVAEAYCREYAKCTGTAPLDCALAHVTVANRECQIVVVGEKTCGASQTIKAPAGDGTACRWDIIDTGGWPVEILNPTSCTPTFVLRNEPPGTGPVVLEFVYGVAPKQSSLVLVYKLTAKTGLECGATPYTCK